MWAATPQSKDENAEVRPQPTKESAMATVSRSQMSIILTRIPALQTPVILCEHLQRAR